MLAEIHIQNYAVITDLSVEFGPGLNLLSGETGSGKSILVDALALALGGRASPDVIRTGCDRASITAVFRSDGRGPWSPWIQENGLVADDESELILRREIQSGGRTRLSVNDQPVTLGAAKQLAPRVVEIHGQGEHVALFSREAQLDLLDQFTGAGDLNEKVRGLYARRRELEQELEALSANERDRLRAMDLMTFELQELDRAALEPGEDGRLKEEKQFLVHLEKIRAAASLAYAQLYEEEGAASARLAAAYRAMEDLSRYDASFEPRLRTLDEARTNIEDLAITFRDYLQRLNAQPHRLDEIESRLALLDRLKRKYGESVERMIEAREQTRRRLQDFEHADERRAQVAKALESLRAEYQQAAADLSKRRKDAAKRMQKLVLGELGQLGMEKTRFEILFATDGASGEIGRSAGGPRGTDEIEFLISPNPGEDLRPLEKIASGGELSRFMLALKTVVGTARAGADRKGKPALAGTFVFDEVDAGVGGSVAEAVGLRLKKLAKMTQVLCVTHLAQIACFADQHFYVEKFERAGRTATSVTLLAKEQERVKELARMLSGSRLTAAALEHAASMIKSAKAASA